VMLSHLTIKYTLVSLGITISVLKLQLLSWYVVDSLDKIAESYSLRKLF